MFKTVCLAAFGAILCCAPAFAADDSSISSRASSVQAQLSDIAGRVGQLEHQAAVHSELIAGLEDFQSCECEGTPDKPWSGSITYRSQVSEQSGKTRFEQRIGFDLNYFHQVTDELSLNFSLERPVSGILGENGERGQFEDELKLGSAFVRLQLGEIEDSAREDAE